MTTTTTKFKCPRGTPMCPNVEFCFMICKQVYVNRVSKKHKWLCFSCTMDDDSYSTGQRYQLNCITKTDFMHICLKQRFTWKDGTYKWYIGGNDGWYEFGLVELSGGKVVKMTQHE